MSKSFKLEWVDSLEMFSDFQEEILEVECGCDFPDFCSFQGVSSPGLSCHSYENNAQQALYGNFGLFVVRDIGNSDVVCMLGQTRRRGFDMDLTFKIRILGDLTDIEKLFVEAFSQMVFKISGFDVNLLWVCVKGGSLEYRALVNMGFTTIRFFSKNKCVHYHHVCQRLERLKTKINFWLASNE